MVRLLGTSMRPFRCEWFFPHIRSVRCAHLRLHTLTWTDYPSNECSCQVSWKRNHVSKWSWILWHECEYFFDIIWKYHKKPLVNNQKNVNTGTKQTEFRKRGTETSYVGFRCKYYPTPNDSTILVWYFPCGIKQRATVLWRYHWKKVMKHDKMRQEEPDSGRQKVLRIAEIRKYTEMKRVPTARPICSRRQLFTASLTLAVSAGRLGPMPFRECIQEKITFK